MASWSGYAAITPDNTTLAYVSGQLALKQVYQNLIAETGVGLVFAEATAGLQLEAAAADLFIDTTGASNLISTAAVSGELRATFDTNKYKANFSPTSAHGLTLNQATVDSSAAGVRITVNIDTMISTVTKAALCTATRSRIMALGGAVLSTAAFVGDVATHSYTITVGTTVNIKLDNSGANYTRRYRDDVATYPISNGNKAITWIQTESAGYLDGVESIELTPITENVIRTVALAALDGTYEYVYLHPHRQTLAAGNTQTYDLDADGDGTPEILNIPCDTWYYLGVPTALTNAVIRMSLGVGTGADTDAPEFKGFCFMVD